MNNKCHRCGTEVNLGERFCRGCGVELVQTQVTPEQPQMNPNMMNQQQMNEPQMNQNMMNQQQMSEPQMNQGMMNQQQMGQPQMNQGMMNKQQMSQLQMNQGMGNQPQMNQNDGETILIENFIGKKAKKIMSSGFSFPAFFFAPIYLIYRKMYLYGFGLWIFQTLLSVFLPKISQYLIIVIGIFVAIKFRDLYLKHVKEEISKIKMANPGANFDGLVALVRSKGGVNKVLGVILGLIFIIMVVAIVLLSIASINSNKLVCTSKEGNITINYSATEVIGYTSNGIKYDLDEQQEVSKRIGVARYLVDFTSWFESNTSGTCKIELKEE